MQAQKMVRIMTTVLGVDASCITLKQYDVTKISICLFAILFLAYLAELSGPTFSTDYIYDSSVHDTFFTSYTADGRYLSEILRHLFGGLYPATFLLCLGLILLATTGLLVCALFEVESVFPVVIVSSLLATFPMIFEIISYPSMRLTFPLALFLATAAMLVRPALGVFLIAASLMLYQSALYFAVAITMMATALRLVKTGSPVTVARTFVLPRAAAVLAGIAMDAFVVFLVSKFIFEAYRLSSFVRLITSVADAKQTLSLIFSALWEFFFTGVFLFPSFAKYLFLMTLLTTLGVLFYKRSFIAVVLVAAAPLVVFGPAWVLNPVRPLILDRVLYPLVTVYVGAFLISWVLLERWRYVVAAVWIVIVASFVVQANIFHVYMDFRRAAEDDLTRQIADRVRFLPGFRPGMPLAAFGRFRDENYFAFRMIEERPKFILNSIYGSVYEHSFSLTRDLPLLVSFRDVWGDELEKARRNSLEMPYWPAKESVAIRDGVVIVKLSKSDGPD
jgi:hypothetical protein